MLTKKQRDLLLFIHERMQEGDVAPSFDEMRQALGLKSKSGIHRLITGLVERGYLERLPHRARALEVKKLPEGYAPSKDDTSPIAKASQAIQDVMEEAFMGIPLCGKIAAGTPIEAIAHEGNNVSAPPDLMGPGEHYALTVDGDSMVNAGINDGDTVIIQKGNMAENGAIIVALVDGNEVTLKRLQRRAGKVLLVPENDNYETRELSPERVQIQGTLVSLMRRY